MATLTVSASDVSLTSWWYEKKKKVYTGSSGAVGYEYYTTTPSSESAVRTFFLAAIPVGSIIHSASLNAARHQEACTSGTMAGVRGSANSGAIGVPAASITPGGTLDVAFAYQAAGRVSFSTGYKSLSAVWTGITLTVEYTPYTACGAPTQVALSKADALPGETVTLSWSGARAGSNVSIAGYQVWRADSAAGSFSALLATGASVLSAQVTAPGAPGSYHFKVKALGSVTGYDSGLSDASATLSVNVTAPSAPASVAVSPASLYPAGEASLSWAPAQGGENNPVTGYAVYRSVSPGGPFAFLKNASGVSCAVEAPQSGSVFFKVLARGQFLDGALSAAASLTADLSGTTGFSPAAETADAGAPLTLALSSNLQKAHTLTAAIGSFHQEISSPEGAEEIVFTPPLSWLAAMPDSETAPMTLSLHTEGAGTVIREVLLRCPDSVVPQGMAGTYAPVSAEVPAAWGVCLSGLSAVRVTLDTAASAPYGASVVRYAIDGPGIHAEGSTLPLEGVSGTLTEGEQTYLLSATDSRGRTGETRLTVPCLPYAVPALRGILSLRTDEENAEQDEGAWIRCAAETVYSSCGGHNAAACAVAYRRQGETAWQTAGNLQNGALHFGGGLISLTDNWELRYTIADALGYENVYYDVVTRARWELHVKRGGGAWAFGGVADADGTLKVYGGIEAHSLAVSGRASAATPPAGDSSTRLATTAFVQQACTPDTVFVADEQDIIMISEVYTSSANCFTAPCDGYFLVQSYGSERSAPSFLAGSNADSYPIPFNAQPYSVQVVYVRKGMRLWSATTSANGTNSWFMPLSGALPAEEPAVAENTFGAAVFGESVFE